jgi:hypothetical protein
LHCDISSGCGFSQETCGVRQSNVQELNEVFGLNGKPDVEGVKVANWDHVFFWSLPLRVFLDTVAPWVNQRTTAS